MRKLIIVLVLCTCSCISPHLKVIEKPDQFNEILDDLVIAELSYEIAQVRLDISTEENRAYLEELVQKRKEQVIELATEVGDG